jgi:AcrR family transcriptional regulator
MSERSLIISSMSAKELHAPAMRERIIQAAESVMRTEGLARATTRQIALAAGCSEGTLYNYFDNKEELFLCVLRERMPSFVALMIGLPGRAGTETVQANLEAVAKAALVFYKQVVPMSASVFSEPEMLARHREGLRKTGVGPHRANEAVAAYLRAEQALGRVRRDVNAETVADLLLGACFQRAFYMELMVGNGHAGRRRPFVREIVQTLVDRIAPFSEGAPLTS